MDKNDLRKEIRQQKRHFSSEELTGMSLRVMERLLCHDRIKNAKTVMMYYSLPDEVFTHDVVDVLLERGVKVVLPVVTGDTTMELREYNGKDDIAIGAFNLGEPRGKLFTLYDAIDVAVVPGMAFDRQGHRLGSGKGYYDRFLSQHPNIYKIGVCFDFQKRETIPAEDHDVRMEEII